MSLRSARQWYMTRSTRGLRGAEITHLTLFLKQGWERSPSRSGGLVGTRTLSCYVSAGIEISFFG